MDSSKVRPKQCGQVWHQSLVLEIPEITMTRSHLITKGNQGRNNVSRGHGKPLLAGLLSVVFSVGFLIHLRSTIAGWPTHKGLGPPPSIYEENTF